MDTEKVLTYSAMIVAGLVLLLFSLDLGVQALGRNVALDVMFIVGSLFVLWQGFETARELK